MYDFGDSYGGKISVSLIGQMMESVELPDKYKEPPLPPKDWATTGAKGRKPNIITSLFLDPVVLENNALELQKKYEAAKKEEVKCEQYNIKKENEVIVFAYGTMARICKTVIEELGEEGISVGLMRPITLFPFPEKEVNKLGDNKNVKLFISVELSLGQMIEDVRLSMNGKQKIEFFGRTGGVVPSPEDVGKAIKEKLGKK